MDNSMKEHDIKIFPAYFEAVLNGKKTFEVRKNDRNYAVGDVLILREFSENKYTGLYTKRKICYMLGDRVPGIEEGYCVLGIGEFER